MVCKNVLMFISPSMYNILLQLYFFKIGTCLLEFNLISYHTLQQSIIKYWYPCMLLLDSVVNILITVALYFSLISQFNFFIWIIYLFINSNLWIFFRFLCYRISAMSRYRYRSSQLLSQLKTKSIFIIRQ